MFCKNPLEMQTVSQVKNRKVHKQIYLMHVSIWDFSTYPTFVKTLFGDITNCLKVGLKHVVDEISIPQRISSLFLFVLCESY